MTFSIQYDQGALMQLWSQMAGSYGLGIWDYTPTSYPHQYSGANVSKTKLYAFDALSIMPVYSTSLIEGSTSCTTFIEVLSATMGIIFVQEQNDTNILAYTSVPVPPAYFAWYPNFISDHDDLGHGTGQAIDIWPTATNKPVDGLPIVTAPGAHAILAIVMIQAGSGGSPDIYVPYRTMWTATNNWADLCTDMGVGVNDPPFEIVLPFT